MQNQPLVCECGNHHSHPLFHGGPTCDQILKWFEYDDLVAGTYIRYEAGGHYIPRVVVYCRICGDTLVTQATITDVSKSSGFFNGNPWFMLPDNGAMCKTLAHRLKCSKPKSSNIPSCLFCKEKPIEFRADCGHVACGVCTRIQKQCPICKVEIKQFDELLLL